MARCFFVAFFVVLGYNCIVSEKQPFVAAKNYAKGRFIWTEWI